MRQSETYFYLVGFDTCRKTILFFLIKIDQQPFKYTDYQYIYKSGLSLSNDFHEQNSITQLSTTLSLIPIQHMIKNPL